MVHFSEALLKVGLGWDGLKISQNWRKGHGGVEKSQQVKVPLRSREDLEMLR